MARSHGCACFPKEHRVDLEEGKSIFRRHKTKQVEGRQPQQRALSTLKSRSQGAARGQRGSTARPLWCSHKTPIAKPCGQDWTTFKATLCSWKKHDLGLFTHLISVPLSSSGKWGNSNTSWESWAGGGVNICFSYFYSICH